MSDSLYNLDLSLTLSQEMHQKAVEERLVGTKKRLQEVEKRLRGVLLNTACLNRTLNRVNQLINGKDPASAQLLLDDIENGLDLRLIDPKKPGTYEMGSWGQCDSCFCALPAPTELAWNLEWYRCTKCGDYDECTSCWAQKKEALLGHPHKMLRMTQSSSFDSARQSVQRDVLSFDGGGIRGYGSLLMFKQFCWDAFQCYKASPAWKERPHEADWQVPATADVKKDDHELNTFIKLILLPKYSLICGTSIGGLNALLMCYGVPLTLLIESFAKYRDDIFLSVGTLFSYHVSKYTAEGLHEVATKIVGRYKKMYPNDRLRLLKGKGGHMPLEEITLSRLLFPCGVTTYDINSRRTWLLNRDENPKVLFLDALLATSAAPSYFPIHNFQAEMQIEVDDTGRQAGRRLQLACVDGGVFANDPRLVALKFLRLRSSPETIYYFLAFGTGIASRQDRPADKIWTDELDFGAGFFKPEQSVGIGAWLRGSSQCPSFVEVFMGSSQVFAEQTIRDLARTGQLHSNKLQFTMEEPIELDDVRKISELRLCVEKMKKQAPPPQPNETPDQQRAREIIAEEQYTRYVQPVKKFFSDCVELMPIQRI